MREREREEESESSSIEYSTLLGLEKDAITYTLSSINNTAICPSYETATIENPNALTEVTPPSTPQVGTGTSQDVVFSAIVSLSIVAKYLSSKMKFRFSAV